MHRLVRARCQQAQPGGGVGRCCCKLTLVEVRWLASFAFRAVLGRKSARWARVLRAFKAAMRERLRRHPPNQRHLARRLRPCADAVAQQFLRDVRF